MTKEKILKAIGNDAWDKIKKLAFGYPGVDHLTEATLTDGTSINYEGKLAVSTIVMVITTKGKMPIKDGNHELKDGTRFITKNGAVSKLTPASGGQTSPHNPTSKATSQAADLKEKIEAMQSQHEENLLEFEALKSQYAALQNDTKEIRQNLTKISRVLEILVENTPDEPVRNRQFAKTTTPQSKAERIAALLKN